VALSFYQKGSATESANGGITFRSARVHQIESFM
jgi:hypothetical protein